MEYTIKGIDKNFWKRVKLIALRRDTTVKKLVMDFLEKLVKDSGVVE